MSIDEEAVGRLVRRLETLGIPYMVAKWAAVLGVEELWRDVLATEQESSRDE